MAPSVRARSGSHLQRIGDTWYYRRVVPPEARHVFGKGEIKISLGTTSRIEAERLEKPHDVEFEARLQQARESGEVPQRKRRLSRDDIDLVAFEYGGGRVAELDHLYTELNTVIPELAPPQWPELRAAIVRLVEGHVTNLGTQYTLDWAYDCWQRAKDRPEQTDDEARRYLDDFMASARVSTLAEVRRSHILKWRKSLQDAGKLAPRSINQRLELVAAILRTGWRDAEMQPVDLQKI